jgi:hypothetical protein
MSGFVARLRNWWAHPPPAGYTPGSLIARLRHDLRYLECQPLDDTSAVFRLGDRQLEFEVRAHVESQFLMHVVTTEFSYRIANSGAGDNRLAIRHRGSWKRTGITCTAPEHSDDATRALAQRLASDAALASALLPLDFTRCELTQDPQGWRVSVVHFGACEVVYRVPPIRQYVRLAPAQLDAMLASFQALQRLMQPKPQGFAR